MESETARRPTDRGTVMASIDGDRSDPVLIIADVSRDEAWLSMDHSDALSLADWQ